MASPLALERVRAGLSQRRLAREAAVGGEPTVWRETINRVEKGRAHLNPLQAVAIAVALADDETRGGIHATARALLGRS